MSGDLPRALADRVRGAAGRPGREPTAGLLGARSARVWQPRVAARAASPVLLAAVVVVLLVLPGLGLPRLTLNLGASIVLFGLAATGLNLMLGYAGMLSLGGALLPRRQRLHRRADRPSSGAGRCPARCSPPSRAAC